MTFEKIRLIYLKDGIEISPEQAMECVQIVENFIKTMTIDQYLGLKYMTDDEIASLVQEFGGSFLARKKLYALLVEIYEEKYL